MLVSCTTYKDSNQMKKSSLEFQPSSYSLRFKPELRTSLYIKVCQSKWFKNILFSKHLLAQMLVSTN